MPIRIKAKYDGKKNIQIEEELGLEPNSEFFITIEPEEGKNLKEDNNKEEHFLLQIAKLAQPAGRSDLSVRHHEVLGERIE